MIKYKSNGVELNGTTVTRVTGKNAKFIVDNLIGPGAILEISKRGEIIPHIEKVLKPAKKAQLPDKKEFGEYGWNASGVDLVIREESTNVTVATKRIYAFLSAGLGVEDFALANVTKCYNAGMTRIKQFLLAKPATFLKLPGVKETSANKYFNAIQSKLKSADLASVAANSGFFGASMGSKKVQWVIDKYDLFKLATMPQSKIAAQVLEIPGFSDLTADRFAEGLPKFIKWVGTLPITFKQPEKVVVKSSTMANQAVCFTGFRNPNLEKAIVAHGGKIASGVNGKTTILVVKEHGTGSSKETSAEKFGIPIYTVDELLRKYKNLLF